MANKVIIDTSMLDVDWQLDETYRVELDTGFVVDSQLLPAKPTNLLTSFSTPANPPALVSLDPPDNSKMTPNYYPGPRMLSIELDRKVVKPRTGYIYLYKTLPTPTLIKQYDVTTEVVYSDYKASFSVAGLLTENTQYYVKIGRAHV